METLNRIERRLKLHDLKVVETVVRLGSMGKAAAALNTSQPAISRSIADLEHALGVRLLERDRRGVTPTEYGHAFLDCGVAVIDALREGIKAIEVLGDPNVGEIRIGCTSPMAVRLLPSVCKDLGRRHAGVSIHVTEVTRIAEQYRELRERNVDLVVGRIAQSAEDDIDTEVLFYDRSYVVAASRSAWTRRRKVQLSELAGERWLLPPLDSVVGATIAEAFRRHGLNFPPKGAVTGSIQLVCSLAESGSFVSFLPGAVLHFAKGSRRLRLVNVDLQIPPWPVGIMTLKKRRLRPVVQLFIQQLRKTTAPLAKSPRN
jgi:DNA-binding transcriptional LysR family regulator